jgi:hypothetical protein
MGLIAIALCALSAFNAFSATDAMATQPVLSQVAPAGMQRGATHRVEMQGTRIADTHQVLLYEPGVKVVEVKSIDDAKVEVQLEVAADCRPGLHACRLVTATGISNVRMFEISPYPTVEEVDAENNDFEKPQPIGLGVTVSGVVLPEDQDFFAVDLQAGQTLSVELVGQRLWAGNLGTGFFDPYVAILDTKRFEQATSDDAPLVNQDGICAFTAKEAGRYIVLVRESAYGGSGDFRYRLHVGTFPRPIAMLPAGGQPGQTVSATLWDAAGRSWQESITLPALANPAFPWIAANAEGVAPGPLMMRVSDLPMTLDADGDSLAQPIATPLPSAMAGQINDATDMDHFVFEAKQGDRIEVEVFARKLLRSPLDAVVDMFNEQGQYLTGSDDLGGPDPRFEYAIPADGKYTVRIRDMLGSGKPGYTYLMELRRILPELEVSLPERRITEEVVLAVPRGQRMAAVMNLRRRDYNDAAVIEPIDLPAGVKLVDANYPAGSNAIQLVLEAAADAPLSGSLTGCNIKPTAQGAAFNGKLTNLSRLILGQNFQDIWSYRCERMAVAVTERMPLVIEPVTPVVPLVQMGQVNLQVKVQRLEGYANPIYLSVLSLPPGVSAPGAVEVPADKGEAIIPLTAAGNASAGQFPIVVMIQAPFQNGTMEFAAVPVNLEVAAAAFQFAFQKTMTEQGGKSEVIVNVEVARPFDGEAEVELLGIPPGVTCPQPLQKIQKEVTQLVFPIEIAADARVGSQATLVVQARVPLNSDRIVQTQGTGEVQIDAPLVTAPAPETVVQAPPAEAPAPAAEAPKRLSRLEQLRQAKQREGQ